MVKRIFGLSLEELYNRDQTAVPFIVFKCIQVIDTYGLDTEGLYRLPGKHHVIEKLKQEFEQGTFAIIQHCGALYGQYKLTYISHDRSKQYRSDGP